MARFYGILLALFTTHLKHCVRMFWCYYHSFSYSPHHCCYHIIVCGKGLLPFRVQLLNKEEVHGHFQHLFHLKPAYELGVGLKFCSSWQISTLGFPVSHLPSSLACWSLSEKLVALKVEKSNEMRNLNRNRFKLLSLNNLSGVSRLPVKLWLSASRSISQAWFYGKPALQTH